MLLVWNVWMTSEVIHLSSSSSSSQTSGNTTVVNNTVNGYTTDITATASAAQAKTVTVISYNDTVQSGSVSGIIYRSTANGVYICTNATVTSSENRIEVLFDNGEQMQAEIVGSDSALDLAVLLVHPEFEVQAFSLGDSGVLKQGEYVISVGGRKADMQSGAVSFGVVSLPLQMQRGTAEEGNETIVDVMETDTSVGTSNSGGALLNLSGELVGMLSRTLTSGNANTGMSYALSVSEMSLAADEIISSGTAVRGYLGVIGRDVSELAVYQKSSKGIPLDTDSGVYVMDVPEDSPAAEAGIRSTDVIMAVNDEAVSGISALRKLLYKMEPGMEIKVSILREGTENTVNVTLR